MSDRPTPFDPPAVGSSRPRRRGLLLRFLLILTPLFLVLSVPGVGALVYYTLHEDKAALAVRFGNHAGRIAASLARYDPVAQKQVARDLLMSMASDRALICAEMVRLVDGETLVSQPPRIGCRHRETGEVIELPVGRSGDYVLRVRFSDAELRQANNLQILLALGVVGIAFLIAVLTSAFGFRFIVGRPLRLLTGAIERTAETGERHTVDYRTSDELGTVIAAFNDLQARDVERQSALDAAQRELEALNRSLEARVRTRTAELEEKIIEADTANRAKSEFLANMSHELRTPLNAVIGFSEVILSDQAGMMGTDKYREYAGDIHDSGVHLLEVINDILDIAKIEAGKFELYDQKFAVDELADACLRLMQERADSAGVALETEREAAGAVLRADMRVCKQMLINLLSNAVKFTPKGGRVVFASRVDANGDLLLSIADTGVGIAPDDLARVLEPFVQAEAGPMRKHEGTGLGLPLVKAFAQMHGGALTLESRIGEGTVATIRFPAARLLSVPAPAPAADGGERIRAAG